jgi:hypothetical protein
MERDWCGVCGRVGTLYRREWRLGIYTYIPMGRCGRVMHT